MCTLWLNVLVVALQCCGHCLVMLCAQHLKRTLDESTPHIPPLSTVLNMCHTTDETMCVISSSFPMPPWHCLIACSTLPDVPHAHISEETKKADYQEGDVIHFTCEPGYTSGPTIKYVCTSGGWLAVRQGTCFCELTGFLFCAFTTD